MDVTGHGQDGDGGLCHDDDASAGDANNGENRETAPCFSDLPFELRRHILLLLDDECDLFSCRLASRKLCEVVALRDIGRRRCEKATLVDLCMRGRIRTLQFAIDDDKTWTALSKDVPWSVCVYMAAAHGHTRVLDWLRANAPRIGIAWPLDPATWLCMVLVSGVANDRDVSAWLRREGNVPSKGDDPNPPTAYEVDNRIRAHLWVASLRADMTDVTAIANEAQAPIGRTVLRAAFVLCSPLDMEDVRRLGAPVNDALMDRIQEIVRKCLDQLGPEAIPICFDQEESPDLFNVDMTLHLHVWFVVEDCVRYIKRHYGGL